MTKYRRKTANAKERERMKLVNQAFDRLREVMPDLNLILDQEKETKVGAALYTVRRKVIFNKYGWSTILDPSKIGQVLPWSLRPHVCRKLFLAARNGLIGL
jgi:hypothetical protein